MIHYTFPNGAVQGGCLCVPGALEQAIKDMTAPSQPDKDRLHREQELYDAFGWPGEVRAD